MTTAEERELMLKTLPIDGKITPLVQEHFANEVVPSLIADVERLEIERDAQDGVLQRLKALITSYDWLADGRGSYRYDDDGYDEEVQHFVRQLLELDIREWHGWQATLAELTTLQERLSDIERLAVNMREYVPCPGCQKAVETDRDQLLEIRDKSRPV